MDQRPVPPLAFLQNCACVRRASPKLLSVKCERERAGHDSFSAVSTLPVGYVFGLQIDVQVGNYRKPPTYLARSDHCFWVWGWGCPEIPGQAKSARWSETKVWVYSIFGLKVVF